MPTRGMKCPPHFLLAQTWATRIGQVSFGSRSQKNWTQMRPCSSVLISSFSSPFLPTTLAVWMPWMRGLGVSGSMRNGRSLG